MKKGTIPKVRKMQDRYDYFLSMPSMVKGSLTNEVNKGRLQAEKNEKIKIAFKNVESTSLRLWTAIHST